MMANAPMAFSQIRYGKGNIHNFLYSKKKRKKEPPQLLHLDCYKNNNITALQQKPQRKEMI